MFSVCCRQKADPPLLSDARDRLGRMEFTLFIQTISEVILLFLCFKLGETLNKGGSGVHAILFTLESDYKNIGY